MTTSTEANPRRCFLAHGCAWTRKPACSWMKVGIKASFDDDELSSSVEGVARRGVTLLFKFTSRAFEMLINTGGKKISGRALNN